MNDWTMSTGGTAIDWTRAIDLSRWMAKGEAVASTVVRGPCPACGFVMAWRFEGDGPTGTGGEEQRCGGCSTLVELRWGDE